MREAAKGFRRLKPANICQPAGRASPLNIKHTMNSNIETEPGSVG